MSRIKYYLLMMMMVLSTLSYAQVTTSSMNGLILDDLREPVIGAVVKATHTATGTMYNTVTQPNGRYVLSGMRVGNYHIEVSYLGMATEQVKNMEFGIGDELVLNFNLKESTTELSEVSIVANIDPSRSSSRTGAEEYITRDRMEKLPTINRSLSDFTKLTPMSSGGNFGGTSYRYNNVTVDGASFNNSFGLSSSLGASGTEPISLEALEQVQVMIAPFDVRNGAFTGAGINSVTKGGTNDFQASAYMYIKSPSMRGYQMNDYIDKVTDFKYKQYGISLGGALIKNKLFFFVNGEMDRQETPINFRPRPDTNTAVSGNYSFADEKSLGEIASFLNDKFNFNPGSYNVTKTPTEADRITARLDWNMDSKNVLSVKYFYLRSFNTNSPSTSGAMKNGRGPNAFAIPFSSSYYRTNNNFNIFMADLTTTINNRMSNTLKVGYSRLRDFRDMDGGFFPEVNIGDDSDSKNPNAFTTFGTEANSYNNKLDTDIIQIQDNFSWNVGTHQLTFGTQSDLRMFTNGYARDFAGKWIYSSINDFYEDVNTGTAKAISVVQQYALTEEFPYAKVDVATLGFYVQDKWAVTPKLNLTYGLRVDVPIFLNTLARNEALEDVVFQGGRTVDVSKYPKTAPLLSPRVGFNYDAIGDRSVVLRGGTGIFSGTPPYVWLSNQAGNNGLLFGKTTSVRPFDGEVNFKPAAGAPMSAGIAVTDPNFKYPQLWKTNFASDYKFGDGWIATAEILFNKDINAIYHQNIALPDYNSSNAGTIVGADNRPYFKTRTIDSRFTDVVLMSNTNKGYSLYTTLQLQKTFRDGFFKGLYLNGSYTFGQSKSVTDGSSSVAFSSWQYRPAIDPNSQELGFSAGSFPSRLLLQGSYKFEWSKHASTSVGMVLQHYSPFRYSYTYNGDLNGDGSRSNDLIFVPATKDQINLVNYTYDRDKQKVYDKRSVDEIWNQVDAFISQDPYLKTRRGHYAERNGGVAPFATQIDLNITHDFNVYCRNGKPNTLRVSFDIVNFANLLNKNWGVQQTTVLGNQQYQFLTVVDDAAKTDGKPTFIMPLQNGQPLTETYKDNYGSVSRWQMMFGVKYLFSAF